MCLLVVPCDFPSGCHFASNDGESPSHNLYKAGESFDFFFEVYKYFLIGPIVVI